MHKLEEKKDEMAKKMAKKIRLDKLPANFRTDVAKPANFQGSGEDWRMFVATRSSDKKQYKKRNMEY